MKNNIGIVGCIACALMLSLSLGCGNAHQHNHDGHTHGHDDTPTEQAEQGKEYTSRYICPMHCKGSGSDVAGTCPVCEMDYVLNKDFQEEKK